MTGRYVFAVRFRLAPEADVRVEPAEFETRLYRPADAPGTEGWLFFRDNLWRGELNDPAHFGRLTEEALGVSVASVEYRCFEVDERSYERLEEAIGETLAEFNAESVSEVLNKYFGSSIQVRYDE